MNEYFADVHIHIGRTYKGKPVKITASRNLTFSSIVREAYERKGLDLIGIIDMHSPEVIEEAEELLRSGEMSELAGGGLRYGNMTVLLGSEVELRFDEFQGTAHFLAYLPTLTEMKLFSQWLATKVKNVQLSTQRMYATMDELQSQIETQGGLLIPAHVFTPFKSVYGNCTDSMAKLLDSSKIPSVELGLSSDTEMADRISELHSKTFLTNSDAHSLQKIGREYQRLLLKECSFSEWSQALWGENGRKITANYGLHPKLGKYHVTRCANCDELVHKNTSSHCPLCGHRQLIKGVSNRLEEVADLAKAKHPAHRPPYIHQVPLEFIPKLGPKKREQLLNHFKTEMNILHHSNFGELSAIIGEDVAKLILSNRTGNISFVEGGGGTYGKVLFP